MSKRYCVKDRHNREVIASDLTLSEAYAYIDEMYEKDWIYAEELFVDIDK